MTTINVKKINDKAILPTYGSEYAAGADLYACLDEPLTIKPHETVMVHTGLAMEIPAGYAGLIYPRSGLASKRGLAPANKVGVVDPDYRGEFMIALHNPCICYNHAYILFCLCFFVQFIRIFKFPFMILLLRFLELWIYIF